GESRQQVHRRAGIARIASLDGPSIAGPEATNDQGLDTGIQKQLRPHVEAYHEPCVVEIAGEPGHAAAGLRREEAETAAEKGDQPAVAMSVRVTEEGYLCASDVARAGEIGDRLEIDGLTWLGAERSRNGEDRAQRPDKPRLPG